MSVPKEWRKYWQRTTTSRRLFRRARGITPGGVESNIRYYKPYPIFVEYGDGGYLYDLDGNEILDFMMGFGAMLLGHNNRDVAIEVIKQLECGTVLGASTEIAVEYMEAVAEAFPSVEKVRLTNSGTEATMHALRVARAFTGKEKLAKAEGAYHGSHDYVLFNLDLDPRDAERDPGSLRLPYGKGIPRALEDLVVPFPFNDWEHTAEVLEANADELAAVIVEPVLCGPGVIPPEGDYLRRLRALTRDLGILLIFDEVLTGFRLAYGGAQEYYGVAPDLTTFGKIAGGGMPLGGFGGREEVMDVLSPRRKGWRDICFHAGTYNAHPLSVAAGLQTLRILQEESPYGRLDALSKELFHGLSDLAEDAGVDLAVTRVASMGCLYFTDREVRTFRDTLANDVRRWRTWFLTCLQEDVLFGMPNPGERAVLCMEHTDEDVKWALEVAEAAFARLGRAPEAKPESTANVAEALARRS